MPFLPSSPHGVVGDGVTLGVTVGVTVGEVDAVGVAEAVGVTVAVGVIEAVGETDAVGETEIVGETDAVGVTEAVGETEAVGDTAAVGCTDGVPVGLTGEGPGSGTFALVLLFSKVTLSTLLPVCRFSTVARTRRPPAEPFSP